MKSPLSVNHVHAEGFLTGVPNLTPLGQEYDDYALRLGLVTEGEKRLNWFTRLFAANWIKQLNSLSPDRGLGKVIFLVLSQKREIGDRTSIGSGDKMEEIIAGNVSGTGPFQIDWDISEAPVVSALWVQPDGDNSKSSFTMTLNRISFSTP